MGGTPTGSVPSIHLVHGSPTERALEAQLLELFAQYDLSRWYYAETIHIEDGVMPHSHPLLTLSPITRSVTYLDHSERLLQAYIHEQMHWFSLLDEPERTSDRAGAEFRTRYPNLPIERPKGTGSGFSNYLHIEVNFLEYQGLRELLGVPKATEIIASVPHYTAIYALVLQDYDEIDRIMQENHMMLPERPPLEKVFEQGTSQK